MEKKRQEFGKHYLVEFVGCDPERLKTVDMVKAPFLEAAKLSGATLLGSQFHQFDPHGVSAMIFIAESHFSIHTWPESGYAAFDVLTCGVMEPERAIGHLKAFFKAKSVDIRVFSRGFEA
jgi:S-adenosylmethionine decarboxylase